MVLLALPGRSNLMAFGATSVDVIMKKINKRNTRSDMEAMLNEALILFLAYIGIVL
jgi:hypothetical protein